MPRFSFPDTTLQFSYPEITPQKRPVAIQETHRDNVSRVHLTSPHSLELYFEVTLYHNLTAQEGYEQLKKDVEERFSECRVTDLQKTRLNGYPAYVFSFQWLFQQRKVYFLERGTVIYRILYDPTLPLNEQILATLTD